MPSPKDSNHDDARDEGRHIFEDSQKRLDIVRDLAAAITSMVMAKAKAASMNVSKRVICMPRRRNPRSRGSASSCAGIAEAISSCRSFIRRDPTATSG